jgi:hypothetical protein
MPILIASARAGLAMQASIRRAAMIQSRTRFDA